MGLASAMAGDLVTGAVEGDNGDGARALHDQPWPEPDQAALAQDSVELIVQVNGKLRGRVRVPSGADESVARAAALADADVQRFMGGVTPKRVVYVAGKLVNIVL